MSESLEGTKPFGPGENNTNYGFSDHYAKQWMKTLAWMEMTLQEKAVHRDQHRRSDPAWLEEHRQILLRNTGAAKFAADIDRVALKPYDLKNAAYTINLSNGLSFAGSFTLPVGQQIKGVVVFADSALGWMDHQVETASYLEQGLAVIQPFLPQETCNFQDHPERRWYIHSDHITMHNSAFIIGGSLAGMEAVELHTTTRAIISAINLKVDDVPVIVDMRGRHHLGGMVASAIYPGWASVIRLGDNADIMNHQEKDDISNTIWGFHQHLDLLAMLQLAEDSNIVFVNPSPTPAPWESQAILWFNQQPGGNVRQCVTSHPHDAVAAILSMLDPANSAQLNAFGFQNGEYAPGQEDYLALYKKSLFAKADFLEQKHAAAKEKKKLRFNVNSLSMQEYKQRIEQSIISVMGHPLPRADDLNVRTKQVYTPPEVIFNLYECLMESVKGIDVAGYLLIPKESGEYPAVICQHGLLGRPDALIGKDDDFRYYRMAWTMAEKGYVVFVPFMNWGWGGAAARDTISKPAYALGIACNRFEVAQLNAIVEFLQSRSEVNSQRIGFYGLSYGGHASLWLGACEPHLAAVVTAGHFNDWHNKLVSTEICPPYDYTRSYITVDNSLDMFTFDVLNQLGHAELATLHAPRPYMVENGLKDPVTPRSWVEAEFAKVRGVYECMGASDLAELSHFDGVHRFWGEESLIFLRKHLQPSCE